MWKKTGQTYNELIFSVHSEKDNLKAVLMEDMGISIRMICNLKRIGKIKLNGKSAKLHEKVIYGDIITLSLSEETNEYLSQELSLDLIYQDVDLLVVNKPYNMVVHPTKSHQENTLLNYAKSYFEKNNIKSKVRFVNRLDRDTTGLVIIAKNQYAHSFLTKENSMWDMKKNYIAFVSGILKEHSGTVNLPMGKVQEGDIRRHVFENGQKAVTHYKVLKEYKNSPIGPYSMVEISLETGRTHQIRCHFAHLGHQLLGDELYDGNMKLINRQALHCSKLSFKTPRSGIVTLQAPLPADMVELQL
ncbi:MAG: RluA family pseudouridine synthase [Filifactoraceae bacterium]